jgi:hypothetical protein
MKNKLPIGAMVCCVFLVSGCSKLAGDEYFSNIKPGSKHEYSFEYRTPEHGVQKGRMVWRVDGTETINGKTYFKEVTVNSGVPGADTIICFSRRDKFGYHTIEGSDTTRTEYTWIPFPLCVGNAWTVTKPKETSHFRAESIENLYLLNRQYDKCMKIVSKSDNGESSFWFAPKRGLVKCIFKSGTFSMETVLEER